jgi:hypothetical protein
MYIKSKYYNELELELYGITFICRTDDCYINATHLCKQYKKKFHDWYRYLDVVLYVYELSTYTNKSVHSHIKGYKDVGLDNVIWIHPHVAIKLIQWLSPSVDAYLTSYIHDTIVKRYKQMIKIKKKKRSRYYYII